MHQRGLAAVSLAAVTLCTAVCGGCSSNTKTTGQASSSPATTQSAMTSASASPGASTAAGGGTSVAVASVGKFGDILVDSQGKTLYLFEKDTSTTSTCYDACATAWPPTLTTGAPTAVDGADQAKLSTTTRTDGKTQIVYNGHPLYYFEGDKAKGDTNGEESSAFGAKWYVVDPAGDKVEGD
ncbi:COG4315 family predicted lipoprotein [Streptomyces sp. NPDC003863]